MIADEVRANLDRFKAAWGRLLGRSPWYEFDGTWPSLGIFDLLTFSLRERPRLTRDQAEVIKAAASAIGILAEKCWTALGVEATLREGAHGVEIEATGGSLGAETQYFAIENQLLKILAKVPTPFPVIGKVRRINLAEDNIIFPFAYGVVTGLSMFGEGPWRKIEPAAYAEFVKPVIRELARGCGEFYGRVMPEEQFGQLPELYFGGLLFPPPELEGTLAGYSGVRGIIDIRDEYGIKPKSLLRLAEGLALMPDPEIRAVGVAFYSGLTEVLPPPRFLAAASQFGTRLGLLRLPAIEARRLCGGQPDWLLAEEIGDLERSRFDIERTIGMLPWVRLGPAAQKQKALRPLFQALASFQMGPALSLLDKAIADDPKRFDLRVQRIFLDMVAGEIELAERKGKGLVSEPGCENDPMVFDLIAMAEFALGRVEDSLKRGKVAYNNVSSGHPFGAEIVGNYSWVLLAAKKFEEALVVINESLARTANRLNPLLNKGYALKMLGREDELLAVEAELLNLAPYDRRVFGNIALGS